MLPKSRRRKKKRQKGRSRRRLQRLLGCLSLTNSKKLLLHRRRMHWLSYAKKDQFVMLIAVVRHRKSQSRAFDISECYLTADVGILRSYEMLTDKIILTVLIFKQPRFMHPLHFTPLSFLLASGFCHTKFIPNYSVTICTKSSP